MGADVLYAILQKCGPRQKGRAMKLSDEERIVIEGLEINKVRSFMNEADTTLISSCGIWFWIGFIIRCFMQPLLCRFMLRSLQVPLWVFRSILQLGLVASASMILGLYSMFAF